MKTSTSQFRLMVTFMEQHGDLSKPSSNAKGKVSAIRLWDELTDILNSDGSGDSKVTEKWKKVWSDYKNNAKKKAARLYKSVSGTGGRSAILSKLSDLERRVLSLIGVQVATGLAIQETRSTQGNQNIVLENLEQEFRTVSPPQSSHQTVNSPQPWKVLRPSTRNHIAPATRTSVTFPGHTVLEIQIKDSDICTEENIQMPRPISSPQLEFIEAEVKGEMVSPARAQDGVVRPQPDLVGQTLRTQHDGRARRKPRRMIRPTHTEQAAQQFLHSNKEWRKFKRMQHRDYMELRREQNRIRELEVRAQMKWQAVGLRALDLIEKLVNKYCGD